MASVNIDALSPMDWVESGMKYGKMAIWAKEPFNQIVVNVLIIVVAMLSTSVGFAPGIIIVMWAMFFIGVALVRLFIRAVM